MATRKEVPYLRLVPEFPAEASAGGPSAANSTWTQLPLFAEADLVRPSLLGFFLITQSFGESFAALLAQVRPVWVFDLRPVPWFNIPRFSRRRAFHLFAQHNVVYCDVDGHLTLQRRDARLASGEISQELCRLVAREHYPGMKGPLIFLLDDQEVMQTATEVFRRTLTPEPKGGWHVHVFDPQSEHHMAISQPR